MNDWSEVERWRFAGNTGERGGAFKIWRGRVLLLVIANDGEFYGWEHVSIHARDNGSPNRMRCPTWDEMDYVKRLFWNDDEAVMQLHPPRAQWVNNHAHVLHLWRPVDVAVPLPPPELVGIKSAGIIVP